MAGHQKTAGSLNWFWYLLTQSPEVAQRLHAEVDAGPGGAPAYEQLQQDVRASHVVRADETGWRESGPHTTV